ncbi:MAG: transglycosylase domain-containing protein, partial [Methylococcales bacterium]|nr:transglycosylase domain-containing protein [Methylococcales bacterium]
YLNEIYLGQDGASSVHGFGLASEFYFGRPLQNLPLHEISALVALVRGPSYYDPRRHPDRSVKRRNLVLDEMHKQGYITKKQAIAAKQKKLNVISRTHRAVNRYPGFLDLVKRQLRREYREDDLTSEGLRVFTTLDTRVQNTLEKTITQKLKQLEKRPRSSKLEAATIVTRREGGEIVALAGGRNPRGAGFNRALDAVRPIGSLIKPVVYLTALEYPDRYTITTQVSDTEIEVRRKKGPPWRPKNYDNKEHGVIALHTALAHSYNLATVHIGMDIGIARIAKTLRNMGVSRPVNLFPSLLLGASPLTPLEVTQMYQTLAGDGFATPLRSIQAVIAEDGERLQSYPYTIRQTI